MQAYEIVMWIIAFVRNSEEFQGLGVNQKVTYKELNDPIFRGFEYGRRQ